VVLQKRDVAWLYYPQYRKLGARHLPQPGEITIRDCVFDQVEQLFNMHFNHYRWCSHRPLASITFENCRLTGAKEPIFLHGDPALPTVFTLKNVLISPSEQGERSCFLDAEHFAKLRLENVTLPGYIDPVLITRSEGMVRAVGDDDFREEQGAPGQSGLVNH